MLGAAPLAAAGSWDQSSFPNWTRDVVERLLTDSPWAKPVSVRFEFQPLPERLRSDFSDVGLPGGIGLPTGIPGIGWPGGPGTGRNPRVPGQGPERGGGSSVPAEVYLTIRWSSALPIRQAIALDRWGRDGLDDPEAVRFLNREEPDYVLEIFGIPVIMAPQGARRLEAELLSTAGLFVKGRSPIRATSAHVPELGEHLSAELRFPRLDPISIDDGTVEFTAEAGPMNIAKKFKLKPMVYRGRLEL